MQVGKWHQELDMFLNIKTTFILEGNVYDMYSYPTKQEDGSERWDMVMLDKYLNSYFHDHGYENIIYFNHIDGFYDPFKGQKARTGDLFTSDDITIREGMGRQNLTEAGTAIRAVLENRGKPAVIIMMQASRYVLSADNVSENERDFYSKLMLASLKKTQARNGDKGFAYILDPMEGYKFLDKEYHTLEELVSFLVSLNATDCEADCGLLMKDIFFKAWIRSLGYEIQLASWEVMLRKGGWNT